MMKVARTWTDQPLEVEGSEVMLSFSGQRAVVEVRKGPATWYVSAGSLFGSQTVRCPDAETAMRVAHAVARASGKKAAGVPAGCELLAPADKEAV
jgi:hypothetical protein